MRILTLIILSLSLASPVLAQTVFQDTQGTQGTIFQNSPTQGQYFDNQGRSGQYQQHGNQGMWQNSDGTSGMWQDIGPKQRAFSDNQGGQGQMQDLGNGIGQFQYQTPRGTTQGSYWQYGR